MKKRSELVECLGYALSALGDEFKYFFKMNFRYLADLITLIIPYAMFFLSRDLLMTRKNNAIGGEMLLPIFAMIIVYLINKIADRMGTGNSIPVPKKRFTEVSDDGEVNVRNDRLQEMILYVADLEDFMERKGML